MSSQAIDWTKRQSEVISAMRFPLIVLVVFVHVLPEYIQKINFSLSGKCLYTVVSEFISHDISRVCVPIFFVVSGYFFFVKINEFSLDIYVHKLKRRLQTLLIPYLIWNIFAVVAGIVLWFLFRTISMPNDLGDPLSKSLYDVLWGGPIDFPLWYVRDLLCMVLLTPVFFQYFKYFKYYGAILLWIVYVLCFESNIPGLSSTAVLYFGIGSYFGMAKVNMLQLFHKVEIPSYIFSVFFLITIIIFNGKAPYEYLIRCFIPIGIVAAFNVTDRILIKYECLKSRLIALSATSFFIYAAHEIFIINWVKGFFARTSLSNSCWGLLLIYFLIPTITICVCLSGYYLLNWMMPGLMRIATGGRAKPQKETIVQ